MRGRRSGAGERANDDWLPDPVCRFDLGRRAERAGRRRVVHHLAVLDADGHGCARRQYHLDRRAFSGSVGDGADGTVGRPESARAVDDGALRHQSHRRRARRNDPALNAADPIREAGAVARSVRDRPLRLGQLPPQTAEAGRGSPAALGSGGGAALYRNLWRLFRRRHRVFDDRFADDGGARRSATRGRPRTFSPGS